MKTLAILILLLVGCGGRDKHQEPDLSGLPDTLTDPYCNDLRENCKKGCVTSTCLDQCDVEYFDCLSGN